MDQCLPLLSTMADLLSKMRSIHDTESCGTRVRIGQSHGEIGIRPAEAIVFHICCRGYWRNRVLWGATCGRAGSSGSRGLEWGIGFWDGILDGVSLDRERLGCGWVV